jgi:hypothetical protein
VVRTSDVQLERASDQTIFRWAAAERRIVYTANLVDYARLNAQFARAGESHSGIICRIWQGRPVAGQLAALRNIDARYSDHEVASQMLYLEAFL